MPVSVIDQELAALPVGPDPAVATRRVGSATPKLVGPFLERRQALARLQLNEWTDELWPHQPDEVLLTSTRTLGSFATTKPLASFAGQGRRARLSWPVNSRNLKRMPLPSAPPAGCAVQIHDGRRRRNLPLQSLRDEDLINGYPVRRFQRQNAQGHKPGTIWLHTNQDLVGFESQNERNFAVLADFHPAVVHVASQPLTMRFILAGDARTHTPDFVLIAYGQPPLCVDVKTPQEAADPEWIGLHAGVAHQLASVGMGHLVWTGVHPRIIQNLGKFASARVSDEDYNLWAPPIRLLVEDNEGSSATLISTRASSQGINRLQAMVVIRRMLWLGHLDTNLSASFHGSSTLIAS